MELDNYTRSIRERKGSAWVAYTSLTDEVAAENRDLTSEEREQMDRIEADLDALNAEETRHTERIAGVNLEDSIATRIAPKVAALEKTGPVSQYDTLRAIVAGDVPGARFESRALGNTPDGGSAVPTEFADLFVDYERTVNPVINVATVLETDDNVPLVIPRKTADQAYGGTVTAENNGIVAADPTISSVTLYTYKYPSITFVSTELARSNVIGLAKIIASGAAREIGIDAGAHFTTGDGTDKPNGFITAATNGGTASGTAADQSTDTFFGPSDLIDLFMSPAAGYRLPGVASWQVATDSMTKIRKIKDSNGNFMYNPLGNGIADTAPGGSLLARPLWENPAMAAPASISKSLAFGDFSAYYVRRLPLRVDTSVDFKFQDDQVAIRTILEVDGDLVDTAAVHYMISADT